MGIFRLVWRENVSRETAADQLRPRNICVRRGPKNLRGAIMAGVIAALFVETNGCYFELNAVEPWDKVRDARKYAGPWPVIAHPPCERWGRFDNGSPTKKGYRPGADRGCFKAALRAVRRYGGVLEHPAHSKAWAKFNLPAPPVAGGWIRARGGWCCHVEQGHYGHKARKATWLFVVGRRPNDLIWGPSPQRLPAKRLKERGYESARRCGALANMCSAHRQRTPIRFRNLLLAIARRRA